MLPRLWARVRAGLFFLSVRYERIFSITEIRDSTLLQWMFGASLLGFFIVFNLWIYASNITIEAARDGSAICWPYFQNCHQLFFFHDLNVDWSRSIFYAALYGTMLLIVWNMFLKRWAIAHVLLVFLFIWEALVALMFAYATTAPYYYYHLFLAFILLFLPHKGYFLKLTFVAFYFLSATVKLDATWILGSYFTALQPGLPIFPDALTPFFTNTVIFSQIVGCWFLLSRRPWLQRTAVAFFTFFHLYSVIFVHYMYPTMSVVPLLILFGPMYRHTPTPFTRRAAAGWVFLALICAFHTLGFVTEGDRRLTLEGNRFGMFMFEANHQCRITADIVRAREDATIGTDWTALPGASCGRLTCQVGMQYTTSGPNVIFTETHESNSSLYRCDPYEWWTKYRALCANDKSVTRVGLRFDHSINGGPFYRIVDVEDICSETYTLFRHNEWIVSPPDTPIVGYPVKNYYREN